MPYSQALQAVRGSVLCSRAPWQCPGGELPPLQVCAGLEPCGSQATDWATVVPTPLESYKNGRTHPFLACFWWRSLAALVLFLSQLFPQSLKGYSSPHLSDPPPLCRPTSLARCADSACEPSSLETPQCWAGGERGGQKEEGRQERMEVKGGGEARLQNQVKPFMKQTSRFFNYV